MTASEIYLDHGATSFPKAPGCVEAMADFMRHSAGNPGRGGHRWTIAASRIIEAAREDIAILLGADPEFTLLGAGATLWLNALFASQLERGARVLISSLEHNAVMRPLRELEHRRHIEIRTLRGRESTGVPSVEETLKAVEALHPDLLILSHASNVSGAVLPVEAIAKALHPLPLIVDGAQTAGAIPFDFGASGISAYVCSGHKGLLGPQGTGALLLAPDFAIDPLVRGGTGSRSESEEMPEFLPDRLEAGTPNGPGIAGLGASCRWLLQRGIDAIAAHERKLRLRLASGLSAIRGIRLPGYDSESPGTGILSFVLDGEDNGELAHWLDNSRGIGVRAGLHCAPAAHRRLGTFPEGTLRAGIGPFNTEREIDELIESVRLASGGVR